MDDDGGPMFGATVPVETEGIFISYRGGIGRRCRLKICCPLGREGSSPSGSIG